ncbi:MAG: aldehyde ferredoxin oxidoreductase N-terminal domain-containing protein [Chloroflexota bacterium]|nr:aldehyde ferredoxin oxidoreductase N-terminal domain-containing protein [Chloroflexota bacterium]
MPSMDLPGYAGQVLYVDLTKRHIATETLDEGLVRQYIGGWGITNRLAYDLIPPHVDPLSPENCIIIGTGPFTGTIVPGSAELLVTSRFPLNGAYCTACGGGHFALMLKLSGYDFVVITGRSSRPVYLKVADDDVQLCDAEDLWGRDSFETVDELRERHEPCSVIPIGPAGENLVSISVTSIDKGGTLGSGGLPAVMGSKNLKAIVAVQGTKGIRVADRVKLQRLVDGMLKRIMSYRLRGTLLEGGFFGMTSAWTALSARISDNWSRIAFTAAPDVKDIHYRSRKPLACPSCPCADKERNRLAEGPEADMVTYMTHYAAMGSLGGEDAVDEYRRSVMFLDAANRYGVCLFSFGIVRELMAFLYQNGTIGPEDTGGIELSESFETTMELMRMTAYREGFGGVLADGLLAAARRVGRGAERLPVHIKGYNVFGDARLTGMGTQTVSQMVNPARCGGCAGIAGSMGSASYNLGRPVEQWRREAEAIAVPRDAIERVFSPTSFSAGRLTRYAEDWYSLSNCLGRCHRLYINRFFDAETQAGLYSAVTGVEATPAELYEAAERAWNLFKLLNVRVGFHRGDDEPPEAWFSPLKGDDVEFPLMDYYKTRVLSQRDVEGILDDYYDERGWDRKTGAPTAQRLAQLGLPTG